MTMEQFIDRVRATCATLEIVPAEMVAWILAMARIESQKSDGSGPTALALYYWNIFGVHWLAGDERQGYSKVSMPANEFEPKGTWIDYRTYPGLDECILNLIWHRDESSLYADLKEHALQALEDGLPADVVYSTWLQLFYARWAEGNSHAVEDIRPLFWGYLGRPAPEPGDGGEKPVKPAKKKGSSSGGGTPGQRKVKVAKAPAQAVS